MPFRPDKRPRSLPRPMSTKNTVSRRRGSIAELAEPGDFCVLPRDEKLGIYEIAFLLPVHKRPSGIIVKKVPNVVRTPQAADHVWNWDGNEERPTVNPQISSKDGRRPWTGYLINGTFVETKAA